MQTPGKHALGHPNTEALPDLFVRLSLLIIISVFSWTCLHDAHLWHMGIDEFANLGLSKGNSLSEVLRFSFTETHPPLSFIFRHLWMELSDSTLAIRGFSLFFGIATILVSFYIGKNAQNAFAGLIIAVLVATSDEITIQSYTVRQYTLLLFFLNAGFYAYLKWQQKSDLRFLLCYFLVGTCGCLTHFSAILFFGCLSLYQFWLWIKQRKFFSSRLLFLGVNLLLLMETYALIMMWHEVLARTTLDLQLHQFYNASPTGAGNSLHYFYIFLSGILNPLFIARDLLGMENFAAMLPNDLSALFWLGCFLLLCALAYKQEKNCYAQKNIVFNSLLALLAIALGLNTLLSIGNGLNIVHYYNWARHQLWLSPFVFLVTGLLLAFFAEQAIAAPNKFYKQWFIIVFATLFYFLHYPQLSLAKMAEEPEASAKDWDDFSHHLQSLDNKHLIFSQRDEFLILAPAELNPYEHYFSDDPYNAAKNVYAPAFHDTHIVFSAGLLFYNRAYLLHALNAPTVTSLLDSADTLVFPQTFLEYEPPLLLNLDKCDTLDKNIITFPQKDPQLVLQTAGPTTNTILVLSISKKVFFEQLLNPEGKAHHCLEERPYPKPYTVY